MGTFECCKRSSDIDIPSPNKNKTINDSNFPYSEFESTIKEKFYVDINIQALIQRNHIFNIEEYSYDEFVPLIEIYNDTTVIDTIIYHVSDSDDESNEDNDKYIFDSVIIVTNRIVLDSQLQDTINSFDHKAGLVECITQKKGSRGLVDAINDKKKIIMYVQY